MHRPLNERAQEVLKRRWERLEQLEADIAKLEHLMTVYYDEGQPHELDALCERRHLLLRRVSVLRGA